MEYILRRNNSGQAMIIAVLSLGGALLGATALAGFLTLYTIRATTNYRNSAEAIFAADAGVNWTLYEHFIDASGVVLPPTFTNGAVLINPSCVDGSNASVVCNDPTAVFAFSEGTANGSRRAFTVDLAAGATTVP